jgi:hypothetical protein
MARRQLSGLVLDAIGGAIGFAAEIAEAGVVV